MNKPRIGWVLDSSPKRIITFPWDSLSPVGHIRYRGIAQHLKTLGFDVELYRPWRRYNAVVFVKMMNPRCQNLAKKLKQDGVKVIFDANVNYYEEFGEFPIPGTRPTPEQKANAVAMTSLADGVVADSKYLSEVCSKFNNFVDWIPDAVDTDLFRPPDSRHSRHEKLRLIWSGIGKKALPLELIEPILIKHPDTFHLTIVTSPDEPHNQWPEVIHRLVISRRATVERYEYKRYAYLLKNHDIIISPRILENSYELAHTEYKITLGMAAGLPALASPQASYVQALSNGGGYICSTETEWSNHLMDLFHNETKRLELGKIARQNTVANYSIHAVATRYARFLSAFVKLS